MKFTMKPSSIFLATLFTLFSFAGYAQEKTDTIKVWGNCGMCQKKIEKAAKQAGATYASWNDETQLLVVKYDGSTGNQKIQQNIAATGYDTRDFTATDAAYNKLHGCCKYERKKSTAKAEGCSMHPNCSKEDCKHDKGCSEGEGAKNCCKKASSHSCKDHR